jgi:hypothetical protein
MLPWEVTSNGHDYATSPWALYVVAASVVVAVVAFAVAVLPPARGKEAAPLAGLGLLASGGFLLGVGFVLAPIGAWWLTDAPLFGGGEARSYIVFRRLLELEVFWSGVTALVVVASLLVVRRRRVGERAARAAVLVAMLAFALAGASALHATRLVGVDCLPRFDRVGHPFVQVGRPRQVEIAVSCGAQYEAPAPVDVVASEPGPLEVQLARDYPLVHVERTLPLTAGRETGPARLQLRAGNEWIYLRTEVSRTTHHFVEQERHEATEEVRLSVGAPRLERGLEIFPLEVKLTGDDPPAQLEVVGWNGSLMLFEHDAMRPLLGPGTLDEPIDDFLLPGVCRGEPPAGAPKAPAECRVPVSTLAGLGSTMLRILTLGVASYVPGREVYRLERASWGPAGGPEIPIARPDA